VFGPNGGDDDYWFICTESMSQVCPYRKHTPEMRLPAEPHEWYPCDGCGKRHRTEQAMLTCKAQKQFTDALLKELTVVQGTGWNPEGSKEPFWNPEIINWNTPYKNFQNNIRSQIWGWMQWKILERDKNICQDCGGHAYEVHHIVPISKGGSDHPSNLKSLCDKCHRKYTNDLLGELGPLRAKQRRIEKVRETVPKSLEEFA
jgi:5-methylcytosine-specific restriction protein A